MLLLTWNLAGRIAKLKSQLKAISKYKADIMAFQEVTVTTKELLREELSRMGYKNIKDSFSLSKEHHMLTGKRKYGLMIASRYELKCTSPKMFNVPWKERILSVDVITEFGKIELHTTHIPPGSSNGWKKIEMLEGIFERLNKNSTKHRILCGDFNTPKAE